MNSFYGLFYCCNFKKMNNGKEIYIDSKEQKEGVNTDEKNSKKNLNQDKSLNNIYKSVNNINNINMNGINFLLGQSNPDLYNHIIKNNLTLGMVQKDINNQNLNIINYNQTQKLSENEDNLSNHVINNNLIKLSNNYISGSSLKETKNISIFKSNISTKKIDKQKQLILSGELFFNKKLKITSNGLENNTRYKKNIFPIYFGTDSTVDSQGISYNDFVVNYPQRIKSQSTNNNDNDKEGRIFKIIYDKNNDFYLSFMHSSILLYYRTNNLVYLEIDKEYYFILGNVFLSVLVQKIGERNKLNIKIEIENQKPEKISFENEQKIKIGREEDNDIEIDIQCISKYHSSIEYDNDKKLYYYRDNNSTNGSTLLIKEDDVIPIIGTMNFKLEEIPFMIKEIDSEK